MKRGDGMCAHHVPDRLGYIEWHADAERRMRAGERQGQCPDCKLWLWAHEVGAKPLTPAFAGEGPAR